MSSERAWLKSHHSGGDGCECVEVAPGPRVVHVRDSKRAPGPTLTFPAASWAVFVVYASGH